MSACLVECMLRQMTHIANKSNAKHALSLLHTATQDDLECRHCAAAAEQAPLCEACLQQCSKGTRGEQAVCVSVHASCILNHTKSKEVSF